MSATDLVLVDSGVWIDALRPRPTPAVAAVVDTLLARGEAAVCEVIIAEVLQGAVDDQQLKRMSRVFASLPCLEMVGVGERAAALALRLRERRITVPATDLLIAATADLHHARLLHRDQHLAVAAKILQLNEYRT